MLTMIKIGPERERSGCQVKIFFDPRPKSPRWGKQQPQPGAQANIERDACAIVAQEVDRCHALSAISFAGASMIPSRPRLERLPCLSKDVRPAFRREPIQRYASAFKETTEGCGSRLSGQTWRTKKIELKRTFQKNGRIDVGKATSRPRQDQAQEAADEKEVKKASAETLPSRNSRASRLDARALDFKAYR